MRRKVGLISLGCPKNLVDGEAMLGLLLDAGFEVTDDTNDADAIIVNTCGFIDSAKEESIAAILDMAAVKAKTKGRRKRVLIVTGCLTERYREEFFDSFHEIAEVDKILGTSEYGDIVETVLNAFENTGAKVDCGVPAPAPATATASASAASIQSRALSPTNLLADRRLCHLQARTRVTTGRGFAYLKIAEGCDNHCSYCVIPSIRGSYVSRPIRDIVDEAKRVADICGQPMEFALVAQDTTRFGMDSGLGGSREAPDPSLSRLPQLIEALSQADGVRYLRLLYCYPDLVDERLADSMRSTDKVLSYIDIPIQHASDSVLRRMNRRYGRKRLEQAIDTLRSRIPDIVIRTTVMTGFPGETESDIQELLSFLKDARFDRLGAFAFSDEEGAAAALMPDKVDSRVSNRRRARVLALQNSITAASDLSRVGLTTWALSDGDSSAATPVSARIGAPENATAKAPINAPENAAGAPAISKIESVVTSAERDVPYVCRAHTFAESPEIDGAILLRSSVPIKRGEFVRCKIIRRGRNGVEAEHIP